MISPVSGEFLRPLAACFAGSRLRRCLGLDAPKRGRPTPNHGAKHKLPFPIAGVLDPTAEPPVTLRSRSAPSLLQLVAWVMVPGGGAAPEGRGAVAGRGAKGPGGGFWDSFRSFGAVGDGSGCIGVSQLAARKEAAGRVRAHNILAQHVWGIGPMSGAKPEFVCRGRSGSSMTVSLRSFAKAGPRLQVSMLSAEFLDRAAQLVAEQKRSQSPFGGTLWEVLGQV